MSTNDVLRLGITYRQFDHWCSQGYVFDDPHEANPGSGWCRELTSRETRRLEIMACLVNVGMLPAHAAKHARALMKGSPVTVGRITISEATA